MRNKISVTGKIIIALMICAVVLPAAADDLNPPPYRGEPLSVFVEWAAEPGTAFPDVPGIFRSVDDDDPTTNLIPTFGPYWEEIDEGAFLFTIPNFIDELPLKLLRIQVTWSGVTTPPWLGNVQGSEGVNIVPGVEVFKSVPNVYTQPDGGYQYFDWEIRPNPDWEVFQINLPANARLEQVVVDSISIPEPASLAMLAVGSLAMIRKRR